MSTMTWTAMRRERLKVDDALDLIDRHRLVSSRAVEAAQQCAALAQSDTWEIRTDDAKTVATVFMRETSDPWVATIDVVLQPKHFRAQDEYRELTRDAFADIISEAREMGVGRLVSQVPETRARTMKCLKAAGFKFEGKMRKAVRLGRSKSREDLYIYALLLEEDGET